MGNDQAKTTGPEKLRREDLFLFKILLCGNQRAQYLSALCPLFAKEGTIENEMGADFKLKEHKSGIHTLKLQYWITSNDEKFKDFYSAYYREVRVCIFISGGGPDDSFDSMKKTLDEVRAFSPLARIIIAADTTNDASRSLEVLPYARDNNFRFCQINLKDILPLESLVKEAVTDLWGQALLK